MMYRSGTHLVFAIAGLLVLCTSAIASEFVADVTMAFGGKSNGGKVYIKGAMFRMDRFAANGDLLFTVGKDGSRTLRYIKPRTKEFWDETARPIDDVVSDKLLVRVAEKKVIGRETLHGYVCRKVLYTYHQKTMGAETRWYAEKLGAPIRLEWKGLTINYSNITQQRVRSSVFATPRGFKHRPS